MKRIDIFEPAQKAIKSFTFIERLIFNFFVVLLIVSGIIIVAMLNNKILVEVPASGGNVTEGVVGTPRFVNPLLASSDADRDVTALVYAGLLKATPEGELIPELAQDYEISEDGLTYTFTLREGAQFHDGTAVTADDVVYTIEMAQNPQLKSAKRANWEGVIIEKIDEKTVRFTLNNVYQPFLENTTLGILPMHIWSEIPIEEMAFSEFNLEPIGAGPYKISSTKTTSSGIVERYKLTSFSKYTLGKPHIDELDLRFYTNEEELLKAFQKNNVDNIHEVSPSFASSIADDYNVITYPLPRVFAVFFNQDEANIFTNIEVRVALDEVLDRSEIVDGVLLGYGTETQSPIPPGVLPTQNSVSEPLSLAEAQDILERNGWEFDADEGVYVKDNTSLSFSIQTANTPELKAAAEHIQQQWEKLGAQVELSFFDAGVLSNEIIRPRDYEALFFGQIIGRDRDPFPFWHSSQRNDPGLNVALYTNITADSLLEDIRTTFDKDERNELYKSFEQEISEDVPAVFVFTPDFIYITDKDLKGVSLGTTVTPSERFLNVHEWHIHTEKVWKIFAQTK